MEQVDPQSRPQEPLSTGLWGSVWFFIWDFLKVFLIALAIIIPVRYFLFQPFIVTGHSMLPNFQDGEYLIIDEISYYFYSPQRGDVVVIHSPQDQGQYFIKRVIGLPGETIEVAGGRVVVKNQQWPEGKALEEKYISNSTVTFGNIHVSLPEDQFYVLGDNRTASTDSRFFGPVNRNAIVGKVFLRAFPLNRFGVFSSPAYQN